MGSARGINTDRRLMMLAFAAMALWFGLGALAMKENHDESQYVAAAALSLKGMIFRDFLSLQPPLHAWLYAPIAALFPSDMFLAMRLATALTALATVALVYRAQRFAGVSVRLALAAAVLMAACDSFQFCATVVRNDMLPALFSAAGVFAAIWAQADRQPRRWAVAGLCFGLAASCKISFAPLGIAVAGFLLWNHVRPNGGGHGPRFGREAFTAYAIGSAAGLLPALVVFVIAPANFFYGVVTFAQTAPFDWYAANGLGGRLGTAAKLIDVTEHLATGPALLAIAVVFYGLWRRGTDGAAGPRALLLWLLASGLLGALIPTPTHQQYILPALPPLFVLLGMELSRIAAAPASVRVPGRGLRGFLSGRRLPAALGLCALVGSAPLAVAMARAPARGLPAVTISAQADWIGDRMRARRLQGDIATLSPHRTLDSGYPLDPRFATGPFVYRSGNLLSLGRVMSLRTATPATIEAELAERPPAAILVGYESRIKSFRLSPDDSLRNYAIRKGYEAVPLPDGHGTLYLRRNLPPIETARERHQPIPAFAGRLS